MVLLEEHSIRDEDRWFRGTLRGCENMAISALTGELRVQVEIGDRAL